MQDFHQTDPDNMHYKELSQGVRHFKEVEEGRDTMCEAVQEYAKEYANEYANEKYIDAYQTISAVSIKEDEQALYDKIVLCSKLERQIQSYQTNVSMDKKLEALHALLQGLDLYNKKQDEVKAQKIQKEFLQMKTQIITYLAQDYSLDEAQANEINAITDEAEYTHRLQDIVTAAKQ